MCIGTGKDAVFGDDDEIGGTYSLCFLASAPFSHSGKTKATFVAITNRYDAYRLLSLAARAYSKRHQQIVP